MPGCKAAVKTWNGISSVIATKVISEIVKHLQLEVSPLHLHTYQEAYLGLRGFKYLKLNLGDEETVEMEDSQVEVAVPKMSETASLRTFFTADHLTSHSRKSAGVIYIIK